MTYLRRSPRPFVALFALSSVALASPAFSQQDSRPFRLIVPSIGLDIPVARGTDDSTLRRAPGYDPHSALPGERGNCVVASHRNVHGAYFWYLTKVKPGAIIMVQTPREMLRYRVSSASLVPESQTKVLEHDPQDATSRLTLYTCTLPVSSNRYVVVANLAGRGGMALGAFNRPAAIPEITSGPLHLLKDKALHARYRSLLRYAREKAEQPVVLPESGVNANPTP